MGLLDKYVKKEEKQKKEQKVYYVRVDADVSNVLECLAKNNNTKVSKIIQNFLNDIANEALTDPVESQKIKECLKEIEKAEEEFNKKADEIENKSKGTVKVRRNDPIQNI